VPPDTDGAEAAGKACCHRQAFEVVVIVHLLLGVRAVRAHVRSIGRHGPLVGLDGACVVSHAGVDMRRHVQQMPDHRDQRFETLRAGQSPFRASRAFHRMDVIVVRADVAGPPAQHLLEHRDELDVLLRAARPERHQTVRIQRGGVRIIRIPLEQLTGFDGVPCCAFGREARAIAGGQRRRVALLVGLAGQACPFPRGRATRVDLRGRRIAVEIWTCRQRQANVRHRRGGIDRRRPQERLARALAVEPVKECEALVEQLLGVGVRRANLVVK
jgi:hypothetical protein